MVRKVDVLLTVFNGEATVDSSVRSILAQTLSDLSIIVVDDGSTDGTPEILRELQKNDDRITVLTRPHEGIVNSANYGLAHCSAPLIARQDADDLAASHRLQHELAYLAANPDCVAVSSSADFIDAEGRLTGGRILPRPTQQADPMFIPVRQPYLLHTMLVVRRTAMEAIGGYRHCYLAEDSDLYWRLQEYGNLHNLDDVLGQYRIHPNSVSGASIGNGRLQAVYSELAGISALRRRGRRPDLCFSQGGIEALRGRTMNEMLTICSRELDGAEIDRLRPAMALKLVEFLAYRPYRMEESDWTFVMTAVRELDRLGSAERSFVQESIIQLGIQMVEQRRWADLRRLMPSSVLPMLAVRVAIRRLPQDLRQRIDRRRVAAKFG